MVAGINCFNELGLPPPMTIAGGLPPGWSIVREDYNLGTGSLHGPMYAGLASHVVMVGDPLSYTFTVPGQAQTPINVRIAVARGTSGIESTALSALTNSPTGKITAAGTATSASNELVFVVGLWGTGSGSGITSDNALPNAIKPETSYILSAAIYYQYSSGLTSPAQGLTCANTNDAFTTYQVAMKSM